MLEVLLAITVLGVVVAMLSLSLSGTLKVIEATESQEEKKEQGKAAGAKAWMVKPFSPTQLVNAVSKLCV